jgi:hypothetical protein
MAGRTVGPPLIATFLLYMARRQAKGDRVELPVQRTVNGIATNS